MHPVAAAPARARVLLAALAGVGAMLLYAGQFVLSRWSIQRTLSLWDLAALRFGVAGVLSALFLLRRRPGLGGLGWGRLIALAIAAGGPYTLIMYGGLSLAPAAHGAVIIPGATPVVAAALTGWWWQERPWPAKVVGLALIVLGLVLVGWPGISAGAGSSIGLGDLLFTVAGVLWGFYTVAARRWQIDPVPVTAAMWALSLLYLPPYAAVAGSRLLAAPRGEVLFQAAYQGLGVAIVALVLYAWAIRVLGASVAALLMPLVPVFGVLLGMPVLGEIPDAVQLAGMLGVSVGMILAGVRRR